MATLGWLNFRDICKFRLLCITHKVIYIWEFRNTSLRESSFEKLLYRVRIRSRKCELMKLYVPFMFLSHLCMQMLLSLLLLRSTGTVFQMNYGPYHFVLLLSVDYIHICYHYKFFLNLLLFVYLSIYLFYYINLTHINVYRFH